MRNWWNQLSSRERRLVGGGGVLTLTLLLYALIWQPFQNTLQRLRQTVAEQRADLAWMRQAALEAKRLRNAQDKPSSSPSQDARRSLLIVVDQTARSAGLGTALKRVEPQGEDKVRVWLEQVDFDQLIGWLDTLRREQAIRTANAVIERQAGGSVDARLILQETGR